MSPRRYAGLGNPELVRAIFAAAFEKNAAQFEDLVEEFGYRNRLANVRTELVEAAKRVFETEDSPSLGIQSVINIVVDAAKSDSQLSEEIVYRIHRAAYSSDVADGLREISRRVTKLVHDSRALASSNTVSG